MLTRYGASAADERAREATKDWGRAIGTDTPSASPASGVELYDLPVDGAVGRRFTHPRESRHGSWRYNPVPRRVPNADMRGYKNQRGMRVKPARIRARAALAGGLLIVVSACVGTTHPPTPSQPEATATSTVSQVPASASATPSATLVDAGSPADTDMPTAADTTGPDATPIATTPPAVARLKSVDVSQFASKDDTSGLANYWVTVNTKGATLQYVIGKTKGSIPLAFTKGELAWESGPPKPNVYWDSKYLAIVTSDPLGDVGGIGCPAQEPPLAWRILVAPLDASGVPKGPTVLATGVNREQAMPPLEVGEGACWGPSEPYVQIDGSLIVYSHEQATKQHPFGSEILIRSLSDGSTVRDISVPDVVDNFELSGTTLVWIEDAGTGTVAKLPLWISTEAHPDPANVLTWSTPPDFANSDNYNFWYYPQYGLAGNLLAWDGSSTGKVWLRDLSTDQPSQISPSGASCTLEAFDGSEALFACASDSSAPWSPAFSPDWLVFWSSTGGLRFVQGVAFLSPTSADFHVSNGLVRIHDQDTGTYWTIPKSALIG
jgi:hypothetical protein